MGIIGESSENNKRYFQEYGNSVIGESLGIIRPVLPSVSFLYLTFPTPVFSPNTSFPFPCPIPMPHSHASFPCLIPTPHSYTSFLHLIPMPHSHASFPFPCPIPVPYSHTSFLQLIPMPHSHTSFIQRFSGCLTKTRSRNWRMRVGMAY